MIEIPPTFYLFPLAINEEPLQMRVKCLLNALVWAETIGIRPILLYR